MIIRQRTCFDAVAHLWRKVVCVDIGRPEDTTIQAELHPAVIEDASEGPTERLDSDTTKQLIGEPKRWTQGEKAKLIQRHLQQNGPATAAEIADAITDKPTNITGLLKRHGAIFKIIEYRKHPHGNVAVWGLRPEEWKEKQ